MEGEGSSRGQEEAMEVGDEGDKKPEATPPVAEEKPKKKDGIDWDAIDALLARSKKLYEERMQAEKDGKLPPKEETSKDEPGPSRSVRFGDGGLKPEGLRSRPIPPSDSFGGFGGFESFGGFGGFSRWHPPEEDFVIDFYNNNKLWEKVVPFSKSWSPRRSMEYLRYRLKRQKTNLPDPKSPVPEDKVRFVCVSDTHGLTQHMKPLPAGDVLLHTGDFTNVGSAEDTIGFNQWLGEQKAKFKKIIVIAGNHDLTFDPYMYDRPEGRKSLERRWGLDLDEEASLLKQAGVTKHRDLLTNCTYLEDEEITIYGTIKIWGSPWQPWFGGWGFNEERGAKILEKWDLIPKGINILLTHGPPLGYNDKTEDDNRAGCVELMHTIKHRVKPRFHCFGHIHEAYGASFDGFTHFINSSTCTFRYAPSNPAIVFDYQLPWRANKTQLEAAMTHAAPETPRGGSSSQAQGAE